MQLSSDKGADIHKQWSLQWFLKKKRRKKKEAKMKPSIGSPPSIHSPLPLISAILLTHPVTPSEEMVYQCWGNSPPHPCSLHWCSPWRLVLPRPTLFNLAVSCSHPHFIVVNVHQSFTYHSVTHTRMHAHTHTQTHNHTHTQLHAHPLYIIYTSTCFPLWSLGYTFALLWNASFSL